MNDKSSPAPPIGKQIRDLRLARGFTLADLARRAGTSAPTLHRYENGWDRFEIDTLRRIGAALGSRLEIRLVPGEPPSEARRPLAASALLKRLAPLFWERKLRAGDLTEHADWVLARVLTSGDLEQVRAARVFFGDDAVARAAERRGVDERTREYWRLILGRRRRASQSHRT